MKLFATILAFATASTAVSSENRAGCYCCYAGSLTCCATCCITSVCTVDADVVVRVTDALAVIEVR